MRRSVSHPWFGADHISGCAQGQIVALSLPNIDKMSSWFPKKECMKNSSKRERPFKLEIVYSHQVYNSDRSLLQKHGPGSWCHSFFNVWRNVSNHFDDRPPTALLSCAPFVSSNSLHADISLCAPCISTEPKNLRLWHRPLKEFSSSLHSKAPSTCTINYADLFTAQHSANTPSGRVARHSLVEYKAWHFFTEAASGTRWRYHWPFSKVSGLGSLSFESRARADAMLCSASRTIVSSSEGVMNSNSLCEVNYHLYFHKLKKTPPAWELFDEALETLTKAFFLTTRTVCACTKRISKL